MTHEDETVRDPRVEEEETPRIPGFYRSPYVHEECRPFAYLNGNDEAVVFVHGLTGSPDDFRAFSLVYADSGFDVYCPLLPGHGSHICFLETLDARDLLIPIGPLLRYCKARYRSVHLVGLSYGAVLALKAALDEAVADLSLFAPAFFLLPENHRKMEAAWEWGLHLVRNRIAKSEVDPPLVRPTVRGFAYNHIPVRTALTLFKMAEELRARLPQTKMPLFLAHGDGDDTTPLEINRQCVEEARPDVAFYHVPEGQHVLPRDPRSPALAQAHIRWLREGRL